MKQEYKVESLNTCTDELQQQTYARRLELEDAHHGYVESPREQVRLQEELVIRENGIIEESSGIASWRILYTKIERKSLYDAVGLAPRERMQQRTVDAPMPQVLEETVEAVGLVLHERAQQRTAEQFEDVPHHPEETVEMVRSVSHERVQQREDAPQSPAEVVEAVTLVPREQAQRRTAEQIGEVPETASQDQSSQRTVESLDVRCVAPSCGGIGWFCRMWREVAFPSSYPFCRPQTVQHWQCCGHCDMRHVATV